MVGRRERLFASVLNWHTLHVLGGLILCWELPRVRMLVFGARSMLAARTLEGLSPCAHCHVSLLGLVVAALIAIELGVEVRLLMAWHVSLVWKSHWDWI